MPEISIREAKAVDLLAINDIYNHYVRASTCTYQYRPSTLEERATWWKEHDATHPVTVALMAEEVVGWGSLSWFRAREGYRFTVEDTVYVRHDRQRLGIGRCLLYDLVERARHSGYRTVIGGISAEQEASIALHRALGFVEVARFSQVGFKFDQWLDCIFMQKLL
jgi:L-amino acid N-acyltransferase